MYIYIPKTILEREGKLLLYMVIEMLGGGGVCVKRD